VTRPVQRQDVHAWMRGPGGRQPRRLRVVPWAVFVARGYRMTSQPLPTPRVTWRNTVTPLGPCLSCGLPCVVEHLGAVLHPACPDPREEPTT
jgi:hypothetical protein